MKRKKITLIHSSCYGIANIVIPVDLSKSKSCICSHKILYEVVTLEAYGPIQLRLFSIGCPRDS